MDEISKGQTFIKGMLGLLLIVFLLIGLIGGYILNDVLRHDDNNDTDLVEDDNDSIAPAEKNESNLESEKENDNFSNIEIPYLEGLKSLTLYVAEFTNDGMIYKSTKITNHSEMEEVLKLFTNKTPVEITGIGSLGEPYMEMEYENKIIRVDFNLGIPNNISIDGQWYEISCDGGNCYNIIKDMFN